MATYTGSDKRLQYLFEHGGGGGADMWTGTQAEYAQQASQIEDGTLVNITDDDQIAQTWHVYSTAEHVVGVWIDGRSIYEKTVSTGAIPASTVNQGVTMGLSNVRKVIYYEIVGEIGSSSETGIMIPNAWIYSNNQQQYGISQQGYNKTTDKLRIDTGTNRAVVNLDITIRYTKTTD